MSQMLFNKVENAKAVIILAHGAGANMEHQFMREIVELLNKKHISVLRFNFPYMDKRKEDGKKYPPDRMPKLLDCYQSVLSELESAVPVFIGGKSMGGRVAATMASEALSKVKGVICLGYPFHPQKKPEKLRLEPLQQATLPVLIIQGERDALGSREEIEQYSLSDFCQFAYLADGDHSFKPRVKSGFTFEQHLASAVDVIEGFIRETS